MVRKKSELAVTEKKNLRDGDGTAHLNMLFTPDETSGICKLCAHVSLDPGSSVGKHMHDKDQEIYYITAGTGIVDDNGIKKRVSAGDAVLTTSGESHSIENDGTEPLTFLAVVLPV